MHWIALNWFEFLCCYLSVSCKCDRIERFICLMCFAKRIDSGREKVENISSTLSLITCKISIRKRNTTVDNRKNFVRRANYSIINYTFVLYSSVVYILLYSLKSVIFWRIHSFSAKMLCDLLLIKAENSFGKTRV